MLRIIMAALRTGRRTESADVLEGPAPPATKGRPDLDVERCDGDQACADACPTTALTMGPIELDGTRALTLDYGACIFCGRCADACAPRALIMTNDYALATIKREDLILSARVRAGIQKGAT